MSNEYEILSHLEKNEVTSQRKIARGTGLSLGTVNLLLKRMVRKGLVKIERLNAKTLRYIITPKGMAEKTRLAYQYMKNSYRQIVKISEALEQVLEERKYQGQHDEVVFLGPRDEILEILKIAAGRLNIKYIIAESWEELKVKRNGTEDVLIITWISYSDEKFSADENVINILEKI
ncbi:winged helix-turn-helix transcriptional regulator [Calderihabitans maritimus]|uniref:Winged helix-turn-helix transcriptional regulator n=1 Tax=Calderihabitans maritimus TaxID=1246530 RepID=A0A1Z5HXJ3_9FIRM|nr:winged helix-turn-helix transcriptional regulator [Calderihabitans maritimus]GAW94035.1 hypothetical protein Daud_1706 [Calderihabitans maritimus]